MIRVAWWVDRLTGHYRAWVLLPGREFTVSGEDDEQLHRAAEEALSMYLPSFLSFTVGYLKIGVFRYEPGLEEARAYASRVVAEGT